MTWAPHNWAFSAACCQSCGFDQCTPNTPEQQSLLFTWWKQPKWITKYQPRAKNEAWHLLPQNVFFYLKPKHLLFFRHNKHATYVKARFQLEFCSFFKEEFSLYEKKGDQASPLAVNYLRWGLKNSPECLLLGLYYKGWHRPVRNVIHPP